ncbi:carboxylating nicotinate-nucleotide diphosphorylase [Caldalkalibacillus salinus]|uniref:carboxylating nicotinate-nucleotide diphosphorylase n=1 Tax=Caldalkalibacillus salinus TaxID=2803787 RepID=UPI0019204D77|nr:carboxylating nicotinate-nucleotide diphosphorylase [Caldalkalibacillus salinus]
MYLQKWKKHINQWLEEDLRHGDLTAPLFEGKEEKAWIRVKKPGIIAGLPIARMVFGELSPEIKYIAHAHDGQYVQPGDVIAELEGPIADILAGERLALNLLQRLSGIATMTRDYVEQTEGSDCRIIDTRKTTPGLRELEKYAVTIGGGHNHRFGLFDLAMLKDNHIKAAGSITEAVRRLRLHLPHSAKIEVEVETLDQVHEALEAEVDIVMLDNMTVKQMKEAVHIINGQALVEASGGISLDDVRPIAETGVDVISVGALTHSVQALDISLDVKVMKQKPHQFQGKESST